MKIIAHCEVNDVIAHRISWYLQSLYLKSPDYPGEETVGDGSDGSDLNYRVQGGEWTIITISADLITLCRMNAQTIRGISATQSGHKVCTYGQITHLIFLMI